MTLWSLLNLMRSLRLKLPLLQKESLAKSGHTHHPRRSRLPATGQIWTPMSSTTSSGLPPQKPTALSAARPRDEQEICRALKPLPVNDFTLSPRSSKKWTLFGSMRMPLFLSNQLTTCRTLSCLWPSSASTTSEECTLSLCDHVLLNVTPMPPSSRRMRARSFDNTPLAVPAVTMPRKHRWQKVSCKCRASFEATKVPPPYAPS
mmetsp:Transcript_86495/g.171715  ORF Transcript_86495/g.171715 Transcript_86495/m.171715 type:complete len:204 (-) Transcript_86495:105-716(-)